MNVKKNKNIILHESSISRKDRENINGHKGTIIWFTGLSGSGKSTLAYGFEYILHKNNIQTYVLDGDNIRQGLCKDLGFSAGDRTENITYKWHDSTWTPRHRVIYSYNDNAALSEKLVYKWTDSTTNKGTERTTPI